MHFSSSVSVRSSNCVSVTSLRNRSTVARRRRFRPFKTRCNSVTSDGMAYALNPAIHRLSHSKTAVLADLARTLSENGEDIISLAIGEPDFPTPEPVAQAAIEAIQSGFTKYTRIAGITELKEAICTKLKNENGLEYSKDCIVVSSGAKQSICQAVMATCGPGDEVLIPAPYWVSYPEMVTLSGATSKIITCPIEDGFLLMEKTLQAALTPNSRLLFLCSPANPTGTVYTKEQLQAIARIVEQHPKLLVLADEIYEYMVYAPAVHTSFASLPEMYERTLTINGFSKAFAMTGWRLGYIAAPEFYANACLRIQSQLTSSPCSISQKAGHLLHKSITVNLHHLGLAALQMGYKGGKVVEHMVEEYRKRRDFVVDQLREIPGVSTILPQGAFYVFPDVSAFITPAGNHQADGAEVFHSTEELCTYLIHEAKVVVSPGGGFGAPNYIRISYAASMDNLKAAMHQIKSTLTKLYHQRGY